MKQFEILSGRCLVAELPEGAIKPHINHVGSSTFIVCHTKSGDGYHQHNIQITPGNWRIIGMLNEVTEEQAATFVKLHATIKKYKDYLTSKEHPTNIFTKTALESLDTLLETNEIYFENPLGVKYTKGWDAESDYRSFLSWHEAQSRVLDRSRCLLLGREV